MNSPYKCYILALSKAVCAGFTAIAVMNYPSTMILKKFKKISCAP